MLVSRNRYDIVTSGRIVGSGSNATVYRCEQRSSVIKVFDRDDSVTDSVRRARTEYRRLTAAREHLHSENGFCVPRPYRLLTEPASIEMEFVEGPTLQRVIADPDGTGIKIGDVAARLARGVCDIIEKVQSFNPDVTFSNLIVQSSTGRIYFVDFGEFNGMLNEVKPCQDGYENSRSDRADRRDENFVLLHLIGSSLYDCTVAPLGTRFIRAARTGRLLGAVLNRCGFIESTEISEIDSSGKPAANVCEPDAKSNNDMPRVQTTNPTGESHSMRLVRAMHFLSRAVSTESSVRRLTGYALRHPLTLTALAVSMLAEMALRGRDQRIDASKANRSTGRGQNTRSATGNLAANRKALSSRVRSQSKILVCAYACGPGMGSEESVGWDTACALARDHDVHVLTRSVHRPAIRDALQELPPSRRPTIHYEDIAKTLQRSFDCLGKVGVELGYLVWIKRMRSVCARLHQDQQFDAAQHVTYARYWMPSPISTLDIPFVFGPVGGGESIPDALRSTLSIRGRLFELLRDLMRGAGEIAPSVQRTVRQASCCLANTDETAVRLGRMGARRTLVLNSAALSGRDLKKVAVKRARLTTPTFAYVGRLLSWKGIHLALRAFARADFDDAKFLVIGSGPVRASLERTARRLDIQDHIRFIDRIPREDLLDLIGQITALVHPSLHDSGGYTCLEAMASRTPVICIDTGGPGLFVSNETGYPVRPGPPDGVIEELARAMKHCAFNNTGTNAMGEAARKRVITYYSMQRKRRVLRELYESLVSPGSESRAEQTEWRLPASSA